MISVTACDMCCERKVLENRMGGEGSYHIWDVRKES